MLIFTYVRDDNFVNILQSSLIYYKLIKADSKQPSTNPLYTTWFNQLTHTEAIFN